MSPGFDDREYSSRDLQDAAGLSARQQNDWDGRGLLPHERDGQEGWRRYTPREIFALMVCAEIRRQYGTPVERLKWVQQFMLTEGANHFKVATELMASLGVGVWLCTDLDQTFIMDSELEFADLWNVGYFGASHKKAFVFLPMNPLVNQLLSIMKVPIELTAHGRGYEIMSAVEAVSRARSPEEMLVLKLIRSDAVDTVEVVSPTGEVAFTRATATQDPAADIMRLLDEPYQRLTVVKKDGKVVHIEQEVTIKPGKATQ